MKNTVSKTTLFLLFGLLSLLLAACTTVSTSGDYTLESGETLSGNLVITSGDAVLEQGSRVTGSVLMSSGNLFVNGAIDGDIVMSSGKIDLGPTAVVRGDIRATSGDITRADGAKVEGATSTNQSTFRIGGSFFASLFGIICIVPLILLVIVFLVARLITGRRQTAPEPAPAPPVVEPAPPTAELTPAEKMQQLKQMLDEGLITQEEFDAKKSEILDNI